ncbi:hypothetical protein [Microcoleus vaginatus]
MEFCQLPTDVRIDEMIELAQKSIALANLKASCWNSKLSPTAGTF